LADTSKRPPSKLLRSKTSRPDGYGRTVTTRAEAQTDLFDYIEPFYNRRRRHSTLGYASPQQFLNNWLSGLHEKELAA
jgi:putative transposase